MGIARAGSNPAVVDSFAFAAQIPRDLAANETSFRTCYRCHDRLGSSGACLPMALGNTKHHQAPPNQSIVSSLPQFRRFLQIYVCTQLSLRKICWWLTHIGGACKRPLLSRAAVGGVGFPARVWAPCFACIAQEHVPHSEVRMASLVHAGSFEFGGEMVNVRVRTCFIHVHMCVWVWAWAWVWAWVCACAIATTGIRTCSGTTRVPVLMASWVLRTSL